MHCLMVNQRRNSVMSGSYYQDFLQRKKLREREQAELAEETKSLSRHVYKIKSDVKSLEDKVMICQRNWS